MNKNIKKLTLIDCDEIKDYSFISYLENLESLYITRRYKHLNNFTNISFLEKTYNLRELNLSLCDKIKNFYKKFAKIRKTWFKENRNCWSFNFRKTSKY